MPRSCSALLIKSSVQSVHSRLLMKRPPARLLNKRLLRRPLKLKWLPRLL